MIIAVILCFLPSIYAESGREIPLDFYLIIDNREAFQDVNENAFTWLNNQILEQLLTTGDSVTIWAAGDRAELIYRGGINSPDDKKEIQNCVLGMEMKARTADFAGALDELEKRLAQTPASRLAYSIMVTASAEGLQPVLTSNGQGSLKWFRTEKYERWQALILAPSIAQQVNQAASAYMNSLR